MGTLEIIAKDPGIGGRDVSPIIAELVSRDSTLNYEKVSEAVKQWAGRETDILGVLMHASERQKGGEYLVRLNELYVNELSRAPIANGGRQIPLGPILRTKSAVLRMYQELGVKLSEEDSVLAERYSK